MRTRLLLFVTLFYSQIIKAEDIWNLSRIVKQATDQTYSLKAVDQEVLRAESLSRQAGKWDNPEVGVSNGPYWEDNIRGTATSASITQSVPIFGQKNIAAKIGQQEKMVVEAERDITRLMIQHEVVRLTYKLAAINEQEKHTVHRRERLALVAQYLKSRPFASPSQGLEKNLIENRVREIEAKFVEIALQKEKTWQNLNVYLGLPQAITPKVPWFDNPALPNIQELNNQILSTNPEIIRQGRVVDSANLLITQAGKRAYPDIRLGAGYYNQEVGADKQKSYIGILELSVPIWNRGGHAKDAARANSNSEKMKFEHKKRQIASDFQQEWAHLNESKKKLEIFPQSLVEKLEKQMRVTEQNWKKGLVTAPAYLELENQVHEQADKVFDAQAEYVHALSQVQFLSGRYFETAGK